MSRLLQHREIVGRKTHQCDLCYGDIEMHERHEVASYTDPDAGIYRFRTHLDCAAVGSRLMRCWRQDSYTSEDLMEWLFGGYGEHFGDEEAFVIARIEAARQST